MTAFNVVRFKVKPNREQDFLKAHKASEFNQLVGMRRFSMVKTGLQAYCVIGEWESLDSIVAARPAMISRLNTFRDCLEDMGGGLGVTDPVSGQAVLEIFAKVGSSQKQKVAKAKVVTKRKSTKRPAKSPSKNSPSKKK